MVTARRAGQGRWLRDAACLLLASGIIVAVPAFALALWMPSSFCSKMALLALAFFTVLVLVLALVLMQFLCVHRQHRVWR